MKRATVTERAMKSWAVMLGLVLLVVPTALATGTAGVPNAHGMVERDPATLHFTMLPMAKGMVEGIDWQRGEMTLTHEHLYDANVRPGTTIFAVRDPSLLDSVQPGDSIYLVVDRLDGRLTLLSLTARHPD